VEGINDFIIDGWFVKTFCCWGEEEDCNVSRVFNNLSESIKYSNKKIKNNNNK
jgi:hypothetical protein